MQCGLMGRKLGHSYSPKTHESFGLYDYSLFEVEPDNLDKFFEGKDFRGINVTIPYKKEAVRYCQRLSDTAKKLGCVNTIVKEPDGSLVGHNTDYFGFQSMVAKSGLDVKGKKVLVLGSGGASATAVAVLKSLDAHVIVISRSGENNYDNLYLHKDAYAIVNTTPVGMYPNVDQSPVDLKIFPNLKGVLDVIYNPARTSLLMQAESLGLITMNGLLMLVAQAKESAQWFAGKDIPDNFIPQIHKSLRLDMENLILVGMPGCGKSTIGKLLAKKTGKTFVDVDEKIVELAKKSIPEIFSQDGEDAFRKIETKAISELAKQSGLVIATGGGCVTRAENYPLLHQNGTIIWLQRELSCLPTEGRPLSQSGSLQAMYEVRKPLYERFADISVSNNAAAENTVQAILSAVNWED